MPQKEKFVIEGPPLPKFNYTSFWEFMKDKLQESGENVAQVFVDTGQQQTFSEILSKSEKLGAVLQQKGVKPGDVVAICSENKLEYCIPVFATVSVGATCAPVNSTYTQREITHVFNILKPKIIFCSASTEKRIHDISTQMDCIEDVIVMSDVSHFPSYPTLPLLLKQEVTQNFTSHKVENPKEEIAFVFCSSGTTGLPKGVMITHHNILFLFHAFQHPDYKPPTLLEKYVIGLLPFFHIYGMMILTLAIMSGITLIIMKQFQAERFLRVIQDYKISACPVVPPIINFLAKYPELEKYDLSSLRYVSTGAAPLSPESMAQLKIRIPSVIDIRQGYGLTELTGAGTYLPNSMNVYASVGKVLPGIQAKIINSQTGKSLGPKKKGELCFRGPLVMKGYINNPQATAETIDSDGWLHTGDIGYYDEDEFFYIVDRVKELIKYKGFQVPPAELEAILMSHPAVMDAAVIGIPDKVAGEVPYAFIVKKAPVREKELLKFVSDQVSHAKRIRGGIEFVESIPKNPSGKILRRELREYMKTKLKNIKSKL